MGRLLADAGVFHTRFERWARGVRGRLVLRRVLAGLAVGLLLAVAATLALWWLRQGALRPWAAALGVTGALAGLAHAWRTRWSDGDVALFLDARLKSDEAISTAVELRSQAERGDRAREVVVRRAAEVLADGDPKRARPRVWRHWYGLLPVAAGAIAWLSIIPLPPPPPEPPPPPGSEIVKKPKLAGLEKIEALANLETPDPEQRERLKKIAEDAKRLRKALAEGLEKREAQARVAKLRDDIAAEKPKLGDEKNRAGLEAAVSKLSQNPKTKSAARALGDGDLTRFDEEMQKLANQVEEEDREEAKKALKEAAEAAKKRGAEELAQSLEEQQRLFSERESKAEALRELARGLGDKLSDEARRDLEEFGESGSPEAQKRLAESLEEALNGLSEQERKQLAENLKRQMQENGSGMQPMTREQIEELSRKLDSPEGREQLKKQLEELAKPKPSGGSQRQQGLNDAERGGAQAQRELGMTPVPMQGAPSSGKQGNDPGKQGGNADNGQGGPGSHDDTGTGDHAGKTDPVPGKELRSKANTKLNPGAPMHGSTLGRTTSRPGETANRAGTGALGQVAPDQISGVERSEVPEEYREQVGRYFQP